MKTIIIASNNTHKAKEIKSILSLDGCEFLTLREAGIDVDPDESAKTYLGNARIKAKAVVDAWHALASVRSMSCEDVLNGRDDNLDDEREPSDAKRGSEASCELRGVAQDRVERDFRDVYVLADDSGLEVDALSGGPGVHSARYAGEDASDADNNAKLLRELDGVAERNRGARFVCQLVMLRVEAQIDSSDGETRQCANGEQAKCGGVNSTQDAVGEITARGTFEGRIAFSESGAGGFGYDPLFLPKFCNYERSAAELSPDEKNAVSHRACALHQLREKLVASGW